MPPAEVNVFSGTRNVMGTSFKKALSLHDVKHTPAAANMTIK
jgi:hypothetical protein